MRKTLAALAFALASCLFLAPVAAQAPEPDAAGAVVALFTAPDGSPAQVRLPVELHQKNRGGSNGAGLCVFASCRHSGRWQNDPVFDYLFEYMWTRPGGGYPAKLDKMIQDCAKSRGLPVPQYIQVESNDLEILSLALKTGRMPGVTYGYSPTGRYGGRYVAHMVSLVNGSGDQWAVLDNNYPGSYEWMSRADFLRAYKGKGTGWAVILLSPPPPPEPLPEVPAPR